MSSLNISIIIVIIFLLFVSIRRKFSLLDLFFVLLPFKTIQIDFGLMVWLFYIPWLFIIPNHFRLERLFIGPIKHYLFFTVFVTLYFSIFEIDNLVNNQMSFFRSNGRYITSIIKFFIFQISPILLLPYIIKDKKDIISAVSSYIFGLKTLTIIGIFQFGIYFLSGYDFLPYGLTENSEALSAKEDIIFSNIGFLRISALGGEPKGLAISLVIGITILSYLKLNKVNITSRYSNLWIFLMCFVLFTTLSTGGLVLILVPFLVILFKYLFSLKKNVIRIFFLSICFLGFFSFFNNVIFTIIDTRILSRSDVMFSEDIDESIWKFLTNNPEHIFFGTGLGNIHLYAYKYIDDINLYNLRMNEVFVSRYGYTKIISESGIIGFAFFLIFAFSVIFKIFRLNVDNKIIIVIFFFSLLIFYMSRAGYCEIEFYFFTGLIISFLNLCQKEQL